MDVLVSSAIVHKSYSRSVAHHHRMASDMVACLFFGLQQHRCPHPHYKTMCFRASLLGLGMHTITTTIFCRTTHLLSSTCSLSVCVCVCVCLAELAPVTERVQGATAACRSPLLPSPFQTVRRHLLPIEVGQRLFLQSSAVGAFHGGMCTMSDRRLSPTPSPSATTRPQGRISDAGPLTVFCPRARM